MGHQRTSAALLAGAATVLLATILARFVWMYPAAWIPYRLSRRLRERERKAMLEAERDEFVRARDLTEIDDEVLLRVLRTRSGGGRLVP
ncbi:hypothetical protein [Lentzea aerocolonigenes]|uniref:hypothetical protein n=1 Tax=Lentzea aerocolonigenes TaxID=68170 RepID=UPI0004C45409|nr:hypothetical protein [Lentzea aerocolonigenes]MCP2242268.1 hypothetical protein [Lentzea aerocolonigenes]